MALSPRFLKLKVWSNPTNVCVHIKISLGENLGFVLFDYTDILTFIMLCYNIISMDNEPQLTPEQLAEEQLSWSLFGIWNKALEEREDRGPMKPRDRIWASELGGAMIDRYLRMKGIPATNPPNMRSLRKFDMGNFFEMFLRVLLKKADVFRDAQEYVVHQYPGLLPVTGRLDYLAGGKPDWNKARAYIDDWAKMTGETVDEVTGRTPRWLEISNNFLAAMEEAYKDKPLKDIIIEAKTCAMMSFERYKSTNKPNPHHVLQLFHYLIGKGYPEGHIFYLSKDDGQAIEFGVFNPSGVEEFYKNDIETMTYYYNNNIQPDPEPQVLFDPDRGTFQRNWKVEYSGYLFHLYGFETPMEYREAWDAKVRRMNGLITRIAEEKPLTKMNLETMGFVKDYFPNFDELVVIAKNLKAKGALQEDPMEAATKEKDESIV